MFNKKPAVSSKLSLSNDQAAVKNKTANIEALTEDANEAQQRTFPFLTNMLSGLFPPQPNCVYPCTLEAYQRNSCCPPEYLPVPVPLDTHAFHNSDTRGSDTRGHYHPQYYYPKTHNRYPYYSQFSNNYFGNRFYQQSQQCCAVCLQYNYYGPPPCTWRNSQFAPNYF